MVIVTFNGGRFIQKCVDAPALQSFSAFEAVVVDNASRDGSADRLELPDARFRLIRSVDNQGFAAGCNRGARGADTSWLAMLNPDAIPNPDWLEHLHLASLRYENASLFGSKQIMAETPETLDGFGDVYSIFGIPWRGGHGWPADSCPKEDCRVFAPCAAAALYRRDFYSRLDGNECVQLCNAVVRHYGSAITGRTSDFTLFHSSRNRVWLLLKNVPAVLLMIMAPLFVLAMAWLLARTRRMQPWRAQWRGFRAARKGLRRVWPKRAAIQRRRVISVRQLARQLVWNHGSVRRRAHGCLGPPLAAKAVDPYNPATRFR